MQVKVVIDYAVPKEADFVFLRCIKSSSFDELHSVDEWRAERSQGE